MAFSLSHMFGHKSSPIRRSHLYRLYRTLTHCLASARYITPLIKIPWFEVDPTTAALYPRIMTGGVQHLSATLSQGFEDDDLGSSSGWRATTVATYCPSRPGELPKSSSLKPCDRVDEKRCIRMLRHPMGTSFSRGDGFLPSFLPRIGFRPR